MLAMDNRAPRDLRLAVLGGGGVSLFGSAVVGLTPNAQIGTMVTKMDGDREWSYTDLEIDQVGVVKTWPKMGPISRLRLRLAERRARGM